METRARTLSGFNTHENAIEINAANLLRYYQRRKLGTFRTPCLTYFNCSA